MSLSISTLITIVSSFIILCLFFLVLAWIFKWLHRILRFIIKMFINLFCVQLIIDNVIDPLIKSYVFFNIGENYLSLISIISGSIIFVLIIAAQKLDDSAYFYHLQASNSNSYDDEKYFKKLEAERKGWVFSLYSLIILISFSLLEIYIMDFIYPLLSMYIPEPLFLVSTITLIGLVILLMLIYNNRQGDFTVYSFYNNLFIIVNIVIMNIFSFFLYELYLITSYLSQERDIVVLNDM
ncbi:MAG TPA: hypothetical protein VK184_03630 [Nostocaceae cyanobacterium]|nr:hypothetical protein [Nostocaceae cyanobacterium]